MELKSEKKVALITGSGSGIGRTLAIEMGKRGYIIMLNGRRESKLQETRERLEAAGVESDFFPADVSDYASCQALIDATVQRFGRLDVLIPNGSESMQARFEDIDAATLERVWRSNTMGAVLPLKAALPHLAESRGSVVFINSLAGLYGVPSASAYSAGKMSLSAMAQSLRIELKDQGIHIGNVFVGFTQNDPEKTLLDSEGKPIPVPERPASFLSTQEDVAKAIIQLVENRKTQIYLSPIGRLTALMSRFTPGLMHFILSRNFQKNSG